MNRWCGVATLATAAFSLASQSQPRDDVPEYLPVSFYVYLKETHPLYRFAPDHPCGRILQLRADKLPIDLAGLEFDDALELSEKGKTLRRWTLPVSANPLGIDGER